MRPQLSRAFASIVSLAALSVVLAGRPLPASAQTAAAPLLPCPTVGARLIATLDTKKAVAGDTFAFTTVAPVTIHDRSLPAGTPGVGVVETLDHSKSRGQSGYFVLEARYLDAGSVHVPVTFVPAGDGNSAAFVRAGSSDSGFLGYLPYYIGTAAGIYDAFHHGKDAAVLAGTILPLVVGDDFFAKSCTLDIDQR